MQRSPVYPVFCAIIIAIAACGGGGQPQSAPEPAEHSLSGLAAQHIAVLPTYTVRVMPGLDWGSSIGRPGELRTILDADLLAALEERGLKKNWIFPAQLQQGYRRNASYAADPYGLAEEPLRSPTLAVDDRLVEPLGSQIRTLVALLSDTRFVLAPVELRLEKAGVSGGRGLLRVVLIDARLSNVRWIGEISSDTVATFGPAITASIASKLANIVGTP